MTVVAGLLALVAASLAFGWWWEARRSDRLQARLVQWLEVIETRERLLVAEEQRVERMDTWRDW